MTASTTSFTVEPVFRRTLSTSSSATPVNRTARLAVMGWFNGVRGAPRATGYDEVRVLAVPALRRQHHVRGVAQLRRRPRRRPTRVSPGDQVQLGASGRRVDDQRGGRRRDWQHVGTRSSSCTINSAPDGPSSSAWWSFMMIPVRPLPSPSTRCTSQSGRPRSRGRASTSRRPFPDRRCGEPCSGRQDRRQRRSSQAACSRGADRPAVCEAPAPDEGGHGSVRPGSQPTRHVALRGRPGPPPTPHGGGWSASPGTRRRRPTRVAAPPPRPYLRGRTAATERGGA